MSRRRKRRIAPPPSSPSSPLSSSSSISTPQIPPPADPAPSPLGLFVPPTYAELLKRLSFADLEAFVRDKAGLVVEIHRTRDEKADKDALIGRFLESAVSFHDLKAKIHSLEYRPAYCLGRLAQEFRGCAFMDQVTPGQRELLDILTGTGLVLAAAIDGRPAYVLPFEVLSSYLGSGRSATASAAAASSSSGRSLLGFLNRLSLGSLKKMASLAGFKPSSSRKAELIAEYYFSLTSRFPAELTRMDLEGIDLLRALFRHGGGPGDPGMDDLPEWEGTAGFEQPVSSYPGYWREKETKIQRAALDLLVKGFILGAADPDIYFRGHPVLSDESAPFVKEFFVREMTARLSALREKLAAPAPSGRPISFADRVLEDFVKIQVAVVCGLVETNSNATIRKRSVGRLAGLLGAPESYVVSCLIDLGLTIRVQGGTAHLKKSRRNPAVVLRESLLSDARAKAILQTLLPFDGWLKRDLLVEFLNNHPVVAPRLFAGNPYIEPDVFLLGFFQAGFLEMDGAEKAVRITGLARRLDEAAKDPTWDPIPSKEKSLHVQPNLELLLPLNAEFSMFEKVSGFAEVAALDRMVRFVLTKESLMRGLESGWTSAAVLEWLEQHARAEIPSTVRHFVESVGRKQGEAEIVPCLALVRCDGLGIKEKILGLDGVDAVRLEGDPPYLAVFHPPAGELMALLKKKKIFAALSMPGKPEAAEVEEGKERPVEKSLRRCLETGAKVKLSFYLRRRWRWTNQVTICGLSRGRVYFMDREGLSSSLPLSIIHSVQTGPQ